MIEKTSMREIPINKPRYPPIDTNNSSYPKTKSKNIILNSFIFSMNFPNRSLVPKTKKVSAFNLKIVTFPVPLFC